MKLIHLSDLHLGKKLNEFPLFDDQKYILQQIVDIAIEEKPNCILIAGDIYDKSIPPAEAVLLLDDFLNRLTELSIPVCIISGNHDSAERLAFGSQLMLKSGVRIADAYDGKVQKVTFADNYGDVNIFLLPFLKPTIVRNALVRLERNKEAEEITTYHEAVKKAVELLSIDKSQRNVLLAHQFITGAVTCDSEAVNVGGVDNIGADVFADFDYVALGHIHSPQNVADDERIRYSGTPLKYSFSEIKQQKSVTVINLGAKGEMNVYVRELTPLRELRHLRGTYNELMQWEAYEAYLKKGENQPKDFFYLTLTDEDDVPFALQSLRIVYKNLLQLDYDNKRTSSDNILKAIDSVEQKNPIELIKDFYEQRNNQAMNKQQETYILKLLEELEGDVR